MSSTPPKPDRGSILNMPRWVKVLGIVFIALVVVIVALHLSGNGLGGIHHMP